MNILIKSATIIDSKSDFNNAKQDILIENGTILKIAKNIENPNNYPEIAQDNLHVSPGWFDSSVSFGEPGFEERETINNGLKAAAASGFTTIALNANTNPVSDSNSHITYVKTKTANNAVTVLPIGALTVGCKGEDLAELYDMTTAGAVSFYDYKKPISNPNLMKIALQYAANFNGLIQSFPQENNLVGKGVVNEHITSTKLGLKGIPALAEELQVARDLFLLEYTGGKLHIPTISSAKSVALIKEAKKKKLDVTCSVAIHNLFFTDAVLTSFDSNFKVLPPLRTKTDIDALIEGLNDGTIDMVTTDHMPIDIEEKKVEFDHAAYGSIGLETAFGALQTIFNTQKTVDILTKGKQRFGATSTAINIGALANLTLFNPEGKYTFSNNNIISTSKNSMFLNANLKGTVYGIIANNTLAINQ